MVTPWVERDAPSAADPRPGADPDLERFARLAAGHLAAPVALVSVLSPDEPVVLGAVGLEGADVRLPAALVGAPEPLVVPDVRTGPAGEGWSCLGDFHVAAYLGCPLHDDGGGQVIGVLGVADSVPRDWTDDQVAHLTDLAAACSSALRLRVDRERARRSHRLSAEAVRHSRLLLLMAEAFTAATTVGEVTRAVSRVAAIGLGATMTGIALLDADGQGLTYTSLDAFDGRGVEALRHARLTDERPATHVARTRLPVFFRSHTAMVERFPEMGAHDHARERPVPDGAVAVLPLASRGRLLGVVSLGWPEPRDFRQENREVKAALAAYTAQSLERALLLEQRRDVARTLQDAMLTALPQPAGFRLAASYLPAAQSDKVGGDWYDGVALPDGDLAVMVGDVTGHDMDAAARMGQLRSTLRAFTWDRPDASPSSWLARLDRADEGLALATVASALVARLSLTGDGARLRWSSAGHPPPVLVRPGSGSRLLDLDNDLLLGVDPGRARHDHVTDLLPGDTVVLYTDGLVERRHVPLEHSLHGLAREAGRFAEREPERFVHDLTETLLDGRPADDVAVLAVRVLPAG
ncbi:SpoIIE family protein phosphatase [Cellulomonas triticagri]|uniref:GAF domain-containing protein n=1 Tax=Cellulomonas triticagri TaxID=2483352 RepID=A0A3M2J2B9_9CELL|nr:SpoIIE family protein phosphatase [Cellulomonas triticagri]RMI04778.1 GAF domain-containing protein [Cellulomonas triticagri]